MAVDTVSSAEATASTSKVATSTPVIKGDKNAVAVESTGSEKKAGNGKNGNSRKNGNNKTRNQEPAEPIDLTFPNGKPAKPDEDAFKTKLEAVNKTFNDAKEERQVVYKKLEKFDSLRQQLQKLQQENKSTFEKLLAEKNAVNKEREEAFSKLQNEQSTVKKQIESIKQSKSKLGYSNVAEIDRRIEQNEAKITAGGLSLPVEKKLVQEITSLRRARRTFEGFSDIEESTKQAKINADDVRKKVTELTKQREEINKKINSFKAESNSKMDDVRKKLGENEKLIEERNKLNKIMKESYDARDKLYQTHRRARDEFFAWQKVEYERKQEAQRAKVEEEKREKVLAKAQKALEDAEVPAYADEISVCNSIISLFNDLLQTSSTTSSADKENVNEKSDEASEESKDEPNGLVAFKRDDIEFFPTKKSNSGSKGNKKNKTKQRKIVWDISTFKLFDKINLPIPSDEKAIAASIPIVEKKLKSYQENQDTKTKANKSAAQAEIERINAASVDVIALEAEKVDKEASAAAAVEAN